LTTADLVSHCIMYTDDDMFYIQQAVALSWIKWMQINYNYKYNTRRWEVLNWMRAVCFF